MKWSIIYYLLVKVIKIFKKYIVVIGVKFGERVCINGDILNYMGIVLIFEYGMY